MLSKRRFLTNTLHWLWVMANDTVAFYMIHPRRSKAAFAALIEDGPDCCLVMAMGPPTWWRCDMCSAPIHPDSAAAGDALSRCMTRWRTLLTRGFGDQHNSATQLEKLLVIEPLGGGAVRLQRLAQSVQFLSGQYRGDDLSLVGFGERSGSPA